MIETTARSNTFQRLLPQQDTRTQDIRLRAILDDGLPITLEMSDSTDHFYSTTTGGSLRLTVRHGVLQVYGAKELKIDILSEVEALGYGKESTAWNSNAQGANVTICFPRSMHSNPDDQITIQFSAAIVNEENVDMPRGIRISAGAALDDSVIQMWERLKELLQTAFVMYATEKARIINMPYKSDLEPWLDGSGGVFLERTEHIGGGALLQDTVLQE